MATANPQRGYVLGLSAYIIWGLFPLYFKALQSIPAMEIIVHRVLWSALFGGLLLWALVEIAVINRTAPWTPPAHPVPIRKEWTSALATVVVFVVVGLVHGWIGPDPFGM